MKLPEFLQTIITLRATEVQALTGWPALHLKVARNAACEFLDAAGLGFNVLDDGSFDIEFGGEFTFAEIVGDWRALAEAEYETLTGSVSAKARHLGVSRPTMYKYIADDYLGDEAVFGLIDHPVVTYRGRAI